MFRGDTSLPTGSAWVQLYNFLRKRPTWKTKSGRIGIHSIIVDSGDQTDTVYKTYPTLVRIMGAGRVRMCKGHATVIDGRTVVDEYPKITKGHPPLYNVGTNQAKRTLMARFKEEGRVVLTDNLSKEVLDELMSEREVEGNLHGRKVKKWMPVPGIDRNEALDCAVYTLALHRLVKFRFKQKEEEIGKKEEQTVSTPEKAKETKEKQVELDNNLGFQYSEEKPVNSNRRNMFRVYTA